LDLIFQKRSAIPFEHFLLFEVDSAFIHYIGSACFITILLFTRRKKNSTKTAIG